LSLDFYQQIFDDMSSFYTIEAGKTVSKVTKEMLQKAYIPRFMRKVKIRNHKPDISFYHIETYLPEISHLLPENMDLPFNSFDEDACLPADDGNVDRAYSSTNDLFERNECIRQAYNNNATQMTQDSIAYHHGSFIQPGSFITISYLFPVLSLGKRTCFKDIVLPVGEFLSLNDGVS
jgi:hypothetical protein